ncbi:cytochrome c, partial [Subdoligranulum sp. OF01-18]
MKKLIASLLAAALLAAGLAGCGGAPASSGGAA